LAKNHSNLGDFAADLIDRRDPSYAVRDLAYKTATGNAITGYFLKKGVKFVFSFPLKYIEGKLIDYFS